MCGGWFGQSSAVTVSDLPKMASFVLFCFHYDHSLSPNLKQVDFLIPAIVFYDPDQYFPLLGRLRLCPCPFVGWLVGLSAGLHKNDRFPKT